MASKFTTTITANTTQHDNAIKKSAQEVYKYQKSVDNAKSVLGNMAKKIPQLVAAVGVSVSAMAAFKKVINQTQSATDSWGRATASINSSLNVLANRISGVGFGDFIDNLKEAAKAARDTYDALDRLGTMTIFQDKSTSDYNYYRAKYEQIIKTSKDPKAVKKAQKDLESLDRQYVAEQQALAQQSLKAYQSIMKQNFAEGGVNVTDNFIETYLGTLQGFEKAEQEYSRLYEKIYGKGNKGGLATFRTDPNTGVGYWDMTGVSKELMKRFEAFKIVIETGDEELKKANQYYINARNIQTKLIQDETAKLKMNEKANNKIAKTEKNENKEGNTSELPETIDEAKNALTELSNEIEELRRQHINVRWEMLTNDNLTPNQSEYLIELSQSLSEQIKKKEAKKKALEDDVDTAINGQPIEYPVGSLPYMENVLTQRKQTLQEYIDKDDIEMAKTYQSIIKELEEQINQKKIDLGLIEPEAAEEVKEISYSIKDAFDAVVSLYSSINTLGDLIGDVFDSEEISNFFNTLSKGLSVITSITTVMENINKLLEITNSLKAANTAATVKQTQATAMDTAASGANASAKAAESIAGATAAGASIPFPYNLIAIAAGIVAVLGALSLMNNYAQGGIIGGSTTVGDHQLAHVNAGEMILNQREQTRLWHMVNGVGVNNNSVNGSVSFRISGSDLVGVLNNYQTKNRRVL